MFRINQKPTFTRDVPIRTPSGSGVQEESLTVTFEIIPDSEFRAFDTQTIEGIKGLLNRLVTGFEGAVADDKTPIPFSEDLKQQALDMPHVRLAFLRQYNRTIAEAVAGNFDGPVAPGQPDA